MDTTSFTSAVPTGHASPVYRHRSAPDIEQPSPPPQEKGSSWNSEQVTMITNELSELRERINRAKALNRASNITYHALGILHTGVSGLVSVTGISKFFSPQVLGVLAASVGIVGAAVTWSKKLNDGRRDAAKELVALEGLELDIQDALVDQTNHTYSSVVEMIKKKTLG